MDGELSLPGRTDVGGKSFSPWVDRFALALLAVLAIFAHGQIASFLDGNGVPYPEIAGGCGHIIAVPIIATSVGKLVVRLFD